MLYIKNFENYEQFKELFAVRECGNGNKSRANKILLSCLKDRAFVREMSKNTRIARKWADVKSVTDMLNFAKNVLESYSYTAGNINHYKITLGEWGMFSQLYRLDDEGGICVDNTSSFSYVRYVRNEDNKVFKMKAGKFLHSCWENYRIPIPVAMQRYCEEVFAEQWATYASSRVQTGLKLVVDDDFKSIYSASKCAEEMGSCMGHRDGDQSDFYKNAVNAKAASLRDENGIIVSRCVIFTDVYDEDDRKWRLAERQYSREGDNVLKRQLVNALIAEGHIDGYKNVGVSCHDARAFVDNAGNSLADKTFRIDCDLDWDDTLSYQDSFKYYNKSKGIAYNNSGMDYEFALDTTDETFGDDDYRHWSEYHECYIPNDDATYVSRRDDWFYNDECIYVNGEYEFEEDVDRCARCGEYFVSENGRYSSLTEADYCSAQCRELSEEEYKSEHWHWSEYDCEYYENEEDIVEMFSFYKWRKSYEKQTVHVDSLDFLVRSGKAVLFAGKYYFGGIDEDGLPYGMNLKSTLELPNVA